MIIFIFKFQASNTYNTYQLPLPCYNFFRIFAASGQPVKFKHNHPRQKKISGLIVKMIVGTSLPLSFVEDEYFRELLQCLEPK